MEGERITFANRASGRYHIVSSSQLHPQHKRRAGSVYLVGNFQQRARNEHLGSHVVKGEREVRIVMNFSLADLHITLNQLRVHQRHNFFDLVQDYSLS
jgi:hypothetical protein